MRQSGEKETVERNSRQKETKRERKEREKREREREREREGAIGTASIGTLTLTEAARKYNTDK